MNSSKRARLKLAPPVKQGPSYTLIRQAVRLFRSDLVPRSVRRANARKWLLAMSALGDKHVYKGRHPVGWGHKQGGA